MKSASHEFTFCKPIAHIILGLGNNLCLWGAWKEREPGYPIRKSYFPWLRLFKKMIFIRKCTNVVSFVFIFVNF